MNKKVIKVLEYIHKNDLNNAEWSIELDTCQSKAMYGTYFDIELPPHIAIWSNANESEKELINNSPDYFLITEDERHGMYIWKL